MGFVLYLIAFPLLAVINALFGPAAAFLGLGALLITMLASGLRVIPDDKLGVVRTFGIYSRTVSPPIVWVAPAIEELVLFDARVQKVTCEVPNAHSADGIPLNLRVYVRASFDPRRIKGREKAARLTARLPSMDTFKGIIENKLDHELRALVGTLTCEEILTPAGRYRLEAGLAHKVYPYFQELGIVPSRYGGIFLEQILLPPDLQHAINSTVMLANIINSIGGDPEQAARLLLQLGLIRSGQTRTLVSLPNSIWGDQSAP